MTERACMYRLFIIIGLLIVLYFLVRRALREFRGGQERIVGRDDMIQDPVCRIYVPRGSAVAESIGGQTYYFCSPGCAQTFQKRLSS